MLLKELLVFVKQDGEYYNAWLVLNMKLKFLSYGHILHSIIKLEG